MCVLRTAFELALPGAPHEELEGANDRIDDRYEHGNGDFQRQNEQEVDTDREQGLKHSRLDEEFDDVEDGGEDGVGRVEQEDGGRGQHLVEHAHQQVGSASSQKDRVGREPIECSHDRSETEGWHVEVHLAIG